MHRGHYIRLLAMVVLSFTAMYVLMYAMVDVIGNVFPNYNQAYMAGLMTAPMVLIELALMWRMYPSRRANGAICAAAIVALGLCWLGIRQQVAIDDAQFVKSMIPHHAGAILMCGKASLHDEELRTLCREIIAGQQAEIEQMKRVMARVSNQRSR